MTSPSSPRLLSASHLKKHYQQRQVVRDVSISIGDEIIGLLGPNGAGKTTSFYMMIGLVTPDAGKVLLNGEDITSLPLHQRARLGIGYLPQETCIFRQMSVADNIMAILQLRKDLTQKERDEKLNALLDEFHIRHIKNSIGISLSGGEKRRVEIARALARDPQFMLLDEPFAGIDPISVSDIKKIIYQLRERGIGVLITDHNVRETLAICERAYIVNQGEIIAEGSSNQILANPLVRDVYLGHEFN
jgi:lipopolysaccharide export system ATP-binding protein